ncbi:MAG: permease [Verrucomicrobia bacterium]|nr:permease [Verrucomicrobiota bacterium]
MSWFTFTWPNFLYSFLALAFEGLPFVLVGSLISGAIAAFVPSRMITGILPKNGSLATLASGLLGLCFPVCECGIVPIVRRLIDKGLPVSCGVTFMLASPIVNPIVAFSTFAAFRGQAPWLNMAVRLVLGYVVAVSAGLIVRRLDPAAILRTGAVKTPTRKRLTFSVSPLPDATSMGIEASFLQKLIAAVRMACDDFIDTAIYFMVGAAVAATFNTAVDQQIILPLSLQPTLSTFSMMVMASILTLCSTSDAFIAATFVSFPIFARMAFMVFGPMFDLKLFFLYSVLFKKRFVVGLGIGLFLFIGIICSRLLLYLYAFQGL